MYNKTYNHKQNKYSIDLAEDYENQIIYESIVRTLEEVPFERISVPLQIKRSLIDGSENEKLMQIGYIKSYSTLANSNVFVVIIFGKYIDAFQKLHDSKSLDIRAVHAEDRNGDFKCITKLIVEIC